MLCLKRREMHYNYNQFYPQGHRRGKGEELPRVRKRPAWRERGSQRPPGGKHRIKWQERVEKLGPRGSRIRPKERAGGLEMKG